SFSFFASFFLFSKEKKKGDSLGIPLSATLTSPFSRETEYSSALSGISSVRGDYSAKPPL
ncbi:hypothetical protein, partial [uncultured Ruminococcus sp.]|uniref:hypothetical protein n=1 Tax=uncultured Ruminococcus sp. TaxID=165186 RepID=UPI0025E65CB5